jgi:hypothetical protein
VFISSFCRSFFSLFSLLLASFPPPPYFSVTSAFHGVAGGRNVAPTGYFKTFVTNHAENNSFSEGVSGNLTNQH